MSERGFGNQFFEQVGKQKGLSKGQINKIISLQKLTEEVAALGREGKIAEPTLVEISRIESHARQKQLADLVVRFGLSLAHTRLLARIVRSAESAPDLTAANRIWEQYFEIQSALESAGTMTKTLVNHAKALLKEPVKPSPETEARVHESADGLPTVADAPISPQPPRWASLDLLPGRGLDVGTMNIAVAVRGGDGKDHFHVERNAFLDVRADPFTKKMLMQLGIDYVPHGGRMYVLGDPAFALANVFERSTRRPMKDGLISPQEPEALQVEEMLVRQLCGSARKGGEVIAFSVPADPIDVDRNVIYHSGSLESILRKLGYTPRPVIEGHAVVLAELEDKDFTGIGISCGGGMFNVCVAYMSMPALTFSTSRGGDWIDNNVASALSIPASQAAAIKEGGVDLSRAKGREEEAIGIYYRSLISYTLGAIKEQMSKKERMPTFGRPVELVCAGGTSLIKGFIDVFREEFEKTDFPIQVSNIRLARDPLLTVSRGCLVAALEEKGLGGDPLAERRAEPVFGNPQPVMKASDLPRVPPQPRPAAEEVEARKSEPAKDDGGDVNFPLISGA